MNENDQSPKPLKPNVTNSPPAWMIGIDDGLKEFLASHEPDISIAMAKYAKTYPYSMRTDAMGKIIDPDDDEKAYLHLLIQATFFKDVYSVDEWHQYASSYPTTALTEDQATSSASSMVKVRAHFLKEALSRLLNLLGAPAAMIDDLQSILGLHQPRSAEVRGEAQRALIADPTASARAIAKKLRKRKNKFGEYRDADHAQISNDLKNGLLARPSNPPSVKIK